MDILKRELSKANKLLGREDVVLLELEAVRHTALDTTREEIAVLREMIEVQKEEHSLLLLESRRDGALRILQRVPPPLCSIALAGSDEAAADAHGCGWL